MENTSPEGKKRDYVLPASILIAALLISISLVYNAGKNAGPAAAPAAGGEPANGQVAGADATAGMQAISSSDHILGDPKAPVKVVEYSDLECPFCKQFHYTMHQVVQAYGGQVAWVYRHSPIDQLHPKARKEAEASECAAELAGSDEGFWKYIDRLMELTPSNNGLDPALLPKIATDIGLDKAKFESCLSSGKYAAKIEAQRKDAENAGGGGTPYSVVLGKDPAKRFVIPGAFPFTSGNPAEPTVKSILDQALQG